ncbi:MAG: nitrate reductase [Gemmataceae bacterium]|nr:nitrate reductase [Gemmataceae bacterium]
MEEAPVQESRLLSLIQAKSGPLTQELSLTEGNFGLGKVPTKAQPDFATKMVCGFCSTGCSLTVHMKEGRAVGLTPSSDYPVNLGMACPKGWEALRVLEAPDRASQPLLRRSKTSPLLPCDLDTAMTVMTSRFKAILQEHGDEAVAFLSTGQITSEEMAFLGALTKFGMGLVHGDGNTRQCMATSVAAYKQSFGFDAPPYTYADFELSDVLIFAGSNLAIAHPILWERVLRNPNSPRTIVIDPRKTETAMAATDHVALAPKSDLQLFYSIAQVLVRMGWIDREFIDNHTEGFDDFAAFLADYSPEQTAGFTGIKAETVIELAKTIHQGKRVSFWWTMGVNQGHEATRTAQAIINLALMTGNIGKPGTGANSITGQCNAMGSRLFSNTTNLLGGHDFLNPEHRAKVAAALGIEVERVKARNSLAYHEILDRIREGKIKGLWVIATNTAHSWIDQRALLETFSKLDFLVVQDMYHSTETARLADLVLPAAAWGEKEGTFINSERRIGLVKKVSLAPGQALSDFNLFKLVAEYWGCGHLFRAWKTPEAVFQILKETTRNLPCDITGIRDYQMLDLMNGIQWPYTQKDSQAGPPTIERRLFADRRFYHVDGRARILFEKPRRPGEVPDSEFPYWLLTGRGTAAQWHTQTRTGKSEVLNKLSPQSLYVEINPVNARELGIPPGARVRVLSRRGSVIARAQLSHAIAPGQIFLPMHYAETNRLTFSEFDPYSKQPSYKACAVRVEPLAAS